MAGTALAPVMARSAMAKLYIPAFTGRNCVVNIALSSGISFSSPISMNDCLSTVSGARIERQVLAEDADLLVERARADLRTDVDDLGRDLHSPWPCSVS